MGSIPAVSVLDLHKRFGDTEILKGVSLVAQDHDVITVIGSSGSGKSTLLRCINFLEIPDRGEIRIRDELLTTVTGKDGQVRPANLKQLNRLRSRLGMVLQNFNLWSHMTVLENIIEAPVHVLKRPRAEAVAMAEALLEKVGMADKRNSYPNFLSGGQKQRAAIARALAMDPQVMLFDEPTSSLDPELVGEVLRVIQSLAEEGRTMILVTHEMSFAREVSTEIVFLHDGRIVEQGLPGEVLDHPASEPARRFLARRIQQREKNV